MEPRQLVIQALEHIKLVWGKSDILWEYKIDEFNTSAYSYIVEITVMINKNVKIPIIVQSINLNPTIRSKDFSDQVNKIWWRVVEEIMNAGVSKIYEIGAQFHRDRYASAIVASDLKEIYPLLPSDCIKK